MSICHAIYHLQGSSGPFWGNYFGHCHRRLLNSARAPKRGTNCCQTKPQTNPIELHHLMSMGYRKIDKNKPNRIMVHLVSGLRPSRGRFSRILYGQGLLCIPDWEEVLRSLASLEAGSQPPRAIANEFSSDQTPQLVENNSRRPESEPNNPNFEHSAAGIPLSPEPSEKAQGWTSGGLRAYGQDKGLVRAGTPLGQVTGAGARSFTKRMSLAHT